MYTYKNISDVPQDIIGIGAVEAGGEITLGRPLENPNFKYLGQADEPAQVTGTVVRDENTIIDAVKTDNTENE